MHVGQLVLLFLMYFKGRGDSSVGAVDSACTFRGTICISGTQAIRMHRDHLSSAVEGPFVPLPELACFEGRFGTRAQRIFGKAGDARAWSDTPQPTRSMECEGDRAEELGTPSACAQEDGRKSGAATAGVHSLGLGGF